MASPCLCSTCLRTRGTVFRSGKSRRKASAGRAASKRFFGHPSVGGGRAGWRRGDTRFFVMGADSQRQQCVALERLGGSRSRVSGGGRLRKARGRNRLPHKPNRLTASASVM